MNQNIKTALIIGGVILAILIIVPLLTGLVSGWQGYGYGMMGSGMMGGMPMMGGMMGSGMMGNLGWGWFMPIFMILFWGLVIWGTVALVRGLSEPRSADSLRGDSALEILKKRYARGEINKEEYETKQKDLTGKG